MTVWGLHDAVLREEICSMHILTAVM